MIEVIDQAGLETQLKTNPHVLVLFYSSWCPFCRSFLPAFNRYAEDPNNQATYIKVRIDEDENPLWETFGLEAVPSVLLFENGVVSRRLDCKLGRGLTEMQFNKWIDSS
ncbi:MAG: thioredoxin family protein [Candidatus Bathyarchaeota archaeon]|nr:thioredoxin family protein [Candidatus Bathyarchaeota archaeon]